MRKGIATPITLVVLMVVFTSLLAATGYMALGALRGGASERVTYQAFTLAESALEAFPLLVRCGDNLPSAYTLSVSGGPALSATYSYPNRESTVPPGGGNIRVQAVAQVGGGKATLEQTFRVGCGILGAVPAALTSRPRVEVSGNAKIVGFDFAADSGFLPVATVRLNGSLNLLSALDQNTGTFNLDVDDATLIPTGSYLRITTGGTPKTYRVEGKSGNTLTLTPLFTRGLTDVILPGAPVELAPYGVKAYDLSTNTLTLSDARGLVKGQKVRVGSFEGVVESVENVQVKVSWSGTPPTSIPEGTPLVAQVLGAASSRTIDTSGGGQILYGSAPSSPLVPTSPDDLFQRVFGMSKEEFRRLYPPVSASSFGGTLQNWEIKSVSGPLNLTGNRELCGKGILVVFGELTVNGTCPQGFQGLVYVAGDYDQQGNAGLRGAVVVEGVANLEGCGPQGGGDDCWTNIAGTQGKQAGGKIEYDPLVLYRLRVMSQGLTSVSPVSGTWRRL
ncbi:hypothetical protein [Thermus aquaticus]|nr:hypothetical protein [Thermus aquaticus]